jgi:hypothetical protein
VKMAETTISIEFDGYWRDETRGRMPSESGVYCVYECTHNAREGTVTIRELIYIGESGDVRERVADHEDYDIWLDRVASGNELCFSFGAVILEDRRRAEAALIFKHKPPENTEYIDTFPFDSTTMSLSGATRKLTTRFTVNRTLRRH